MATTITTLVDIMEQRATQIPDRPAFIFKGYNGSRSELTFADLYRLGGRWAYVLKSKGLARGSIVANALLNSPERVVCECAVLLSGAATVNAMCQLADGADLLHTLKQSRAAAIVLDPDVTDGVWAVLQTLVKIDANEIVISDKLPSLKHVFFIRRSTKGTDEDFISQLENRKDWFKADDISKDDICTVFTTSGSTGFSKLVVYPHETYSYIMSLFSMPRPEAQLPETTNFNPFQLGNMGGYIGATFASGRTRILYDLRSGDVPEDDVKFLWNTIVEEKCVDTIMLPRTLKKMLDHVKEVEAGNGAKKSNWILDSIGVGGLTVTKAELEAIGMITKVLQVGYGSTEVSAVTNQRLTGKTDFVDCDAGTPIPGCEVQIIGDDDKKTPIPANSIGRIQVKHSRMFREYLNDPKATADAFTSDGFFRTGDVGKIDLKGHLIVLGRDNDVINGHRQFYPGWLEIRIRACPYVQEVSLVGIPDQFSVEEICCCVILKSDDFTLNDVRQYVEKDISADNDDPMLVCPRFYLKFETFPLTNTGKPVRRQIREIAVQRLTPTMQAES